MADEMIEGTTHRLGTKDYVIPALNLKGLRKVSGLIEELQKADNNVAAVQKAVPIVYEALKRNYPEITLDEVEEILDMRNIWKVLPAIYGQSGLTELGETKALQPSADQSTGPTTGQTSTDS